MDEGRRDVCPESTSRDRDDPNCYDSTDRFEIENDVNEITLRFEELTFEDIKVGWPVRICTR